MKELLLFILVIGFILPMLFMAWGTRNDKEVNYPWGWPITLIPFGPWLLWPISITLAILSWLAYILLNE